MLTIAPLPPASASKPRTSKHERRQLAWERLQRIQARHPVSAANADSGTMLQRIAVETIDLLEQRIRYWISQGDDEHVRRLLTIRQRLRLTYVG
ncbi:MAG: hypothetical protein HJJLKODD_00879 [Phycisphaerae bacterium]|nr:hypothetical protein [Phycisphaerae bacterium]